MASQVIRRLRRGGVRDARYDAATCTVRFIQRPAPDEAQHPDQDKAQHPDQNKARHPDQNKAQHPDQNKAQHPDQNKGQRPSKEEPTDDVPTVIELAGLLTDRSGTRRDRRARLDRFVAGFLRTQGVPADWDQARPLLRPVLRGSTLIAPDVSTPLRRPAWPYLAEFVVVDQPETMTYVSADQLTAWGVDADEVFATARRNLSGAVLRGVAQKPTVVQFLDDGDAYWTSHLLLDGWLAGLAEQVGGVPVAFAPERGTLLVVADGGDHLPEVFGQAEEIYASSPRAITPMAYVSDAHGHTVPYATHEGHPMHWCVQRAEAVLAATEYARQAGTLPGDPPELLVVRSETAGWRTRAVWPKDEPALLPAADEVLAGDRLMPWSEIVPHLTAAPDLDPPRWQAPGWPPYVG
jgi:hypothetical protein